MVLMSYDERNLKRFTVELQRLLRLSA